MSLKSIRLSIIGLFVGLVVFVVFIDHQLQLCAAKSRRQRLLCCAGRGARDYFLEGWSRITWETTQDIQAVFYGRAALPGEMKCCMCIRCTA